MEIGDSILFSDCYDHNNNDPNNNDPNNYDPDNTTPCEIWKIRTDDEGNSIYDVLLTERNVLFENLYILMGSEIDKGSIVIYKKKHKTYEALVTVVDWVSNSAQIRIIQRDLQLLN